MARGCERKRTAGGVYLECGGPGGLPLEAFLCDPVIPASREQLGISAIGIKVVQVGETPMVLDWIGEEHYPTAVRFIEEARRIGISRKVSKVTDFSKLTKGAELVMIHPKAYLAAAPAWLKGRPLPCPTGNHAADLPETRLETNCIGALWHLEKDSLTMGPKAKGERYPWPNGSEIEAGDYENWFTAPHGRFIGALRPHDVGLTLTSGIILKVPIDGIAVVMDRENPDNHKRGLAAASRSGLPVRLAEE